jgi:predicted metal-dependent phosphoesterase TrpH
MIKIDLHVHSMFSWDSNNKPEQLIKVAKKRGLSGIAITDHDTIKGGVITSSLAETDFHVIIGSEINTEVGDIIGLFLQEEIEYRTSLEVIEEIKAQDGLLVLPHPLRGHKNLPEEVLKKVDVIEAFNGRCNRSENERARKLAQECKKEQVAGSDAHILLQLGYGLTAFENAISLEDMRKALVKGDIYVIEKYPPTAVKLCDFANQLRHIPFEKKKELLFHPGKVLRVLKRL